MLRMRETRTAKGLSLSRLSEMTGIDVSQLSRYEAGRQAPSVDRAILVARALGVTVEFLSCGEPATAPAACGVPEQQN